MNTKTLRNIALLSASALTLVACGSKGNSNAESKTITIMLDHDYRIDDIGNYLQKKYPEVTFDFLLGRTGVAYLNKAGKNNAIPDIMISGSTWGRAGNVLNEYLYDFSATDIASNFYSVYLDNYTTEEGKTYWLPGCAAIEGIMANKALFEEHHIALPTDYPSFVNACNEFTKLGIRPFASDYKYDYTDAYLLQSLSIPLLQSKEGKKWRVDYEGGKTDVLDSSVGLQMFQKLDSFFDLTGVTSEDASRGFSKTMTDFVQGKTAMIRQSTNNGDYYSAGMTSLEILPYFGPTSEDNWYFTTPSFAVAMKGSLKGSDKEDTCLSIVRDLFSQDCMNLFADEVQSFSAYNKGIEFQVKDEFKNIVPYVKSNHMYTYLSQDNFQAASKVAVQKMIKEDATPEQALAAFNEAVVKTAEEAPTVATLEKGYARKWSDENGNAALSAITNTFASLLNCEIMLSPSTICSGDIYAGSYTEEELLNLILGGGINLYRKDLTGAQIKNIVSLSLNGGGTKYDPIGLSTLPCLSGASMDVSKSADGKFSLTDLKVGDASIDEKKTYSFVYVDTSTKLLQTAFSWNKEAHDGNDVAVSEGKEGFDYASYEGFVFPSKHGADYWKEHFVGGGKLSAPTKYITVK